MKIFYLTVPSFFDLEISLIRELAKECDITVMLIVSPESMRSSAFSVEKLLPNPQIVSAKDFPGLQKYEHLIDQDRWHIANNPNNSLKSSYKLAKKIRKFIESGEYDLIHSTTDCKTSLFLMPFLQKFPHLLYTNHDPIPHSNKSRLQEQIKRRVLFGIYKNLLFLSPSLTNEFLKIYKSSKLKIYYSQLGPYDFLNTYSHRDNIYGKYILFFGRLVYYKGVDLLVKVFSESKFSKNGYKLIIAGRGDLLNNIDDISPNVIVLNRYIENEELANLIRYSEAVILPYRTATQSGCVMSAYAFNKPVLATDVGDFPLVIENDKSGIIVSCSELSLLSGLNQLFESDLNRMSAYIKTQYENNGNLSWNHIAKELIKIYDCIVKD